MAQDNTSPVVERNHYLISPVDVAQRAVCEKIEQVSRNRLISTYKIRLNPGYMTTICAVYLESMIDILVAAMRENKGDAQVDFMNLISIASSNRVAEDYNADKDGNINIKFRPGPGVDAIMERDYVETFTPETWDTYPELKVYEKACSRILSQKHKMTSSNPAHWTIICGTYLQYLFQTLKLMAKTSLENGNGGAAMINFLDIIEFHINLEQKENPENPELHTEQFTVRTRPGFSSKLIIKSDMVTEAEDDD